MSRYSAWSLFTHGLSGQRKWRRAWRDAEPKPHYGVIIVGGGGHGLATAYYLAKEHGITDVAVLEKGWLGGGNTGRNTTIVRSNYLLDPNSHFYEKSMKLWEGLSQELNFNVMFSQRGVLNLGHSDGQMDAFARRGNVMRLNGIEAELMGRDEIRREIPYLNFSASARFPIMGGLMQRRGGTVRHDAVAWGFARAADGRGVDIVQNCEVTAVRREGARVVGVETSRGFIGCDRIGFAVAGNTGRLAAMAGFRLPIESHVLQAFVSEGLKPTIDHVVTYGAGHFYVSQSDKGGLVFGGDLDLYNSYAQRGNLAMVEHVVTAGLAMVPHLSRLRIVRGWGGVVDMSMDGSPIISTSPLDNLYLNCGWCYGGFKATPASGWVFAYTIANGRPHELNAAMTLDRFETGRLLDEKGGGPFPWVH